ncbi:hypothetical protein CNMCM8714_007905 [Aspergillus fumigatus]|nr:hypothetical protein CNMCM8714_007905 [Aspergillus fumigatus]
MMRSVIPLVVSLGSLAAAINITSPAANTTYAAGSTVAVRWTSVDTDPTNFSLYLWNFVSWPPTYVPLALDIPTADLSAASTAPTSTSSSRRATSSPSPSLSSPASTLPRCPRRPPAPALRRLPFMSR